MGIVTFETVIACALPPSRIFKAVVFNLTELLSKVMPQAIKSVDIVQGDGGVGTIRQVNFAEGIPFKYVKESVEAIDEEKLTYTYTVIEGDVLKGVEKIQNDIKFEASSDGVGTIITNKSHYYTIGDHQISEDESNGKDQMTIALFKALEAYLLANPDI
ncbi:major allergen Pru ar 1-like [Euphorbia lathyris]|uniref:major allergen Pru ar 1-like n=1 Tax=Euphorbia lathyris TaxID=212925 RepID=UPI003313F131